MPRLTEEEIANALMQRNGQSKDVAQSIARSAEGNYRYAQVLLTENEDTQFFSKKFQDWMRICLRLDGDKLAEWIGSADSGISTIGREKQKQFLRYFNHLLEQSIRIKVLGAENILLGDNEKDFAQRLNKIASVSQQQAIIEELDRAAYYVERNANAKMLFQAVTIKLYHIIQNKTLILMG